MDAGGRAASGKAAEVVEPRLEQAAEDAKKDEYKLCIIDFNS